MIRLSLHGTLHDVYCMYDGPGCVVVLTAAGITLRVPAEDSGESTWPVEVDSNPRRFHHITVPWLRTILEPRSVGAFHVVDAVESTSSVKSFHRTLHRRVRCYRDGEDPNEPSFTPFFVYGKLFSPYLALHGVVHEPSEYMRESAVLNHLLPLCHPSPAPLTYYYSCHEELGSSCSMMEDLSARMVTSAAPHPSSSDENVALAKRVMQSLALFHGKWLAAGEEGDDRRERELKSSLVHPMVFFTRWKDWLDPTLSTATEDEAAKAECEEVAKATGRRSTYVAQLPASHDAAAFGPFFPEEALCTLYGAPSLPSVVVEASSTTKGDSSVDPDASPPTSPSQLSRRTSAPPTWQPTGVSSLSLIHGSLHETAHIVFLKDARQMPNCILLDWKHSGIGPVEIDVVDALMTLLPVEAFSSRATMMGLLEEYCECLSIFHGVKRCPSTLLSNCRDISRLRCYAKTRSEGFEWGATKKREMIAVVNALSTACCAEL